MANIVEETKSNMEKRLKAFEKDLTRIRTGRASINMLEGVKVMYYGNPTPLNQVSTLTTPDARTIVATPFEKSLIAEIEKAIMKADLGLQPTNDGNVVRVPVPALTEDRRKEIVKNLKKMAEDVKVSIRHVRRDSNEEIKKQEKAKEVAEDESKRLQQEVQKQTDHYVKLVDDRVAAKEKEIMKV